MWRNDLECAGRVPIYRDRDGALDGTMKQPKFLISSNGSKAASLPPHSKFVAIAIVLACSMIASAQKKSSCIECHIKLDDTRLSAPAKLFDNDIHKSRGLSCNDCHGGDPNADTKEGAKDPRKG